MHEFRKLKEQFKKISVKHQNINGDYSYLTVKIDFNLVTTQFRAFHTFIVNFIRLLLKCQFVFLLNPRNQLKMFVTLVKPLPASEFVGPAVSQPQNEM